MRSNLRQAFTLLELLVAISIVGMLLALLLPAVMRSRATARRAQCSNNLRNVGLGILGTTEAHGRFPAAGNFSTAGATYHSWVVNLLPWIERGDIASQWQFDTPFYGSPNGPLSAIQIGVLVCPDADAQLNGRGNLSYVVNGGFGWTEPQDCPVAMNAMGSAGVQTVSFDLNGNGVTCPAVAQQDGSPSDRTLYFQTGLFFAENWPVGSGTVRHHSLDTVKDGLSRTVMIAENLRGGAAAGPGGCWSSPAPWGNSFYLSGYVCENAKCSAGHVDWRRANDRSQPSHAREAINGTSAGDGPSPWPSSRHPGGVNIVFCDGHLVFLNEDVDGAVYASLVTPQGSLLRGPLIQPPLSDDGR